MNHTTKFLLLAVLGAGQAMAAGVFVANPGEMTRYEVLPGYTLIAVDNPQLRRDMVKLPRLKRALETSLGIDVRPTGIPTYVYIVSSSIWDRYLEPNSTLPGEFVPTRFANYIIANNARIDRQKLFHQHTHLYLYNQMPGVYPLWFDEGLAVMMANAQYTGTQVQIFPARHDERGGWLPIERVLRATKTSPEYLDEGQLLNFHFQSHAMVFRALVDEPDFGKKVTTYLEAVNNLAAPEEAEKAFGVSNADLNMQMRGYVNESGKNRVMLDTDGVTELTIPSGTPVSKLDALLGIATICLDAGLHVDMVHELLDAADAEDGGKPRVLPLRMRLAARQKDDARLEEIYAALSKNASDPKVARATGLALFERAQVEKQSARRTELMSRSIGLLNASLTAQADDPEAVWAFAMQAAELRRDLDVALQRLMPMFGKLPDNPEMAQAAGLVLFARGETNLMPYLVAVQRYAHTLEQKRWAVERMKFLKDKAAAAGTN
jgi:hypothetical protein